MPALDITNLTKQYGELDALKGINLSIKEGEFFALLGPNGAGKTTAIGIISGLVNKTSGSVHIFGHDNLEDYKKARSLVGLVPQELAFDPFFTVEEIMDLQGGYYGISKKTRKKRIEKLLRQFDLHTKAKVNIRKLSGGMKRRLFIAKALIHNPKLLILDEPTAGVDVELRKETWKHMQKLNKEGLTILLTTHYIEEAEQLCDSIAVINHGSIIACDKTENMLNYLHEETIYITVDKPRIPKALKKCNVTLENSTLKITFDKDSISYDTLFKTLQSEGMKITSINIKKPSLEDVFLHLTK